MKKLLACAIILSAQIAWGQEGISARGMSMAGAFQGLARGPEVTRWNPANLALPGAPEFCLDMLNFGLSIGNNSLNIDAYNRQLVKDRWETADKEEIAGLFPDEGFRGFARFLFTPVAFSYKMFAFSVSSFSYTDMRLPKSLFDIPLQGLGHDPVELNDVEGESIAATEITMSTAKAFEPDLDYLQHLSLGITFKYFVGHGYAKVEEAEGSILSNEDSIGVNGSLRFFYASPYADIGSGGDGVGLDLGAAAVVTEKLMVGLSLRNIVGSINFGVVEERYMKFNFNVDGLSQDEFDHFGDYIDSVLFSMDTTYTPFEAKKYEMPRSLNLSATYIPFPKLALEADYNQGLNKTAGGSVTPRLSLGMELRYVPILPLRFGFAVGGVQGTTFAAGFGFDLGPYELDFAFAGQRGLFNSSKGINFAVSQRIILY